MRAAAAHRERGSISLELVILAPALLALIGLVVVAGRVAIAGQTVQQAAAQAARDTSLERTPAAARTAGRDTAAAVLIGQGMRCTSSSVDVDASDLALPVGTPGAVTVDVTCRVRLADVGLPGVPGARTLRGSATMPTDPWTAR